MKFKNVKPLGINLFEIVDNRVYMSAYDSKTNQVIVYKLDDLKIDKAFFTDAKSVNTMKILSEQDGFFIKVTEKSVTVKTEKSNFIGTLLDQVYIPELRTNNLIEVKTSLKALKKASKFTATSDARPALKCVHLAENGTIMATDSYKVYRYKREDTSKDEPIQYLIPTNFIDSISSSDDGIVLQINKNYVLYEDDDIKIYSTLSLESAVNIEQLYQNVKSKNTNSSTIYKHEIMQEMKILGLLIQNRIVKLSFIKNGVTTISTHQQELSNYESTMPSKNFLNNDLTIAFTYDLLNVVIASCEEEEITINFLTESHPILIEEANEAYIILPIKL